LHRRIALHIVRRIGTSRATIVLGFMLATAGLSMWISNTATTLLNFVGVALITATFYLLAKPILGLDLTTIPAWAK
jgi:sodium-dependent dicarboxylate transporter 2/3/5